MVSRMEVPLGTLSLRGQTFQSHHTAGGGFKVWGPRVSSEAAPGWSPEATVHHRVLKCGVAIVASAREAEPLTLQQAPATRWTSWLRIDRQGAWRAQAPLVSWPASWPVVAPAEARRLLGSALGESAE